MIIYGSSLSPYVRKVLACASEKGIEVDVQAISLRDKDPRFVEASPFGKMPALRDGDFTLADSSAIVHYFEALKPQPALIPADARLRGKTIWFEEFADTVLVSCGAKMFFNRVVAPRFMGRPGDLAAADAAELNDLPPLLDYLESVAPGDDGFLVGEGLTLADIAVAGPFANFRHMETAIDPHRYPRTLAYVNRILARPSLARLVERETAFLASMPA